jgi:hypothetical protein
MLHDQFPFSHDKLICCLIIQLSHMTNSYAAWSIPILTWQTHMLPDHSAFSRDKLICCMINSHSHVTNSCCLIIQLSHVTNSHAAWSFSFLTWQTHMLPDHSAFSRDKLICCLIIQLSCASVTKINSCWMINSHSHVTNSYANWSFSFLMWQTHMLLDHSAYSCVSVRKK